jgi:hypothetical protein
MTEFIKNLSRKINGIAFTLVSTGVAFILLSAVIVWYDMAVRILIGMICLFLAYGFIYFGVKLLSIRRDLEKMLKF